MRSSAAVACRALVMLGCLVLIPLAAVSGSSLTGWVDTALQRNWPWPARSSAAQQAQPHFELMSPDEALWPENLPRRPRMAGAGCQQIGGSLKQACPAPPAAPARCGLSNLPAHPVAAASRARDPQVPHVICDPAVVSAGAEVPMDCRNGVCRLVDTSIGRPLPGPSRPERRISGAERPPDPLPAIQTRLPAPAASPAGPPSRLQPVEQATLAPRTRLLETAASSPQATHPTSGSAQAFPSAPVTRRAPAPRTQSEQGDPFSQLGQRLQQLGATYYLLEHWGDGQYRFYCRVATAGNPRLTEDFEQIDADPLRAMGRVVEQVEAWRSGLP